MPENVINPCMWECGMMSDFVKSMIMKFAKKCDDSRQFCAKCNIYLISNEKQTFYTKKDKQDIL